MDTRTWARLYIVDVITLVLGTAVTLRFWYVFSGIRDLRLITILSAIVFAEVGKRLFLACRRAQQPQLFCGDRRADLMAALALGTTPWPITVPVNAASPLWALGQPIAQPAWVGPLAAVIIVAVALRKLISVA